MLNLLFSAVVEALRSTKVVVGDTRLIDTFSAEEILRSLQIGGGIMLDLDSFDLLSRQLSTSLVSGFSVENPRLLVSVEDPL